MISNIRSNKLLALAGLAATAAMTLSAAPSVAQSTYADSNEYTTPAAPAADDITVYAPRTRERDNGDTVSASRVVYIGDLDLNAGWGRHTAHARIERAARKVCDQLSDDFPNSSDDDGACVPNAVSGAMAQVHDIAYRQNDDQPW